MSDKRLLREAICAVGADLYRVGLNAGRAGNISARLSEDVLLVTARGTHKGRLTPSDVVEVALEGPVDERATTEIAVHRSAYLARPDVGAVIHAHAPALTAAGLRRLDIPAELPEVEIAIGKIETVEFLPSGSDLLGHAVGRVVSDGATVVLLRGHGVVTVGPGLEEARDRLEYAESAAVAVVMAAG